jgi:hypothetical protein
MTTYTVWLRHQDGGMSRSDQEGPIDEAIESAFDLADEHHRSERRLPPAVGFICAREHRAD